MRRRQHRPIEASGSAAPNRSGDGAPASPHRSLGSRSGVASHRGGALGAPPGRYPAYALFEYTLSGEHHAAVARADVALVADTGGRRARPLLVGVSALAATLALLAVAWRRAAARS